MLNFDHWIAALRRAMKQVGIVSEYLLFIFEQSALCAKPEWASKCFISILSTT
jgi:hypothetical protein